MSARALGICLGTGRHRGPSPSKQSVSEDQTRIPRVANSAGGAQMQIVSAGNSQTTEIAHNCSDSSAVLPLL